MARNTNSSKRNNEERKRIIIAPSKLPCVSSVTWSSHPSHHSNKVGFGPKFCATDGKPTPHFSYFVQMETAQLHAPEALKVFMITDEYPTRAEARAASMSLLFSINQQKPEGVPIPFGAVIERYLAEELPERNSTVSRYQSWLKNYVKPMWGDCLLDQIKPLAVEDWLKKLALAPKSRSHLKNLMRILFNASMRWELIPYALNPMSLVRVKNGSKRKREPTILSVDEFQKLLEHIPEPFRTMCVIAMCMGLRASEILGLK